MINSKKTLVGLDACFRFGTDGEGRGAVKKTFTFLKLTMIIRIKEIIITAGGENVAPTNIEEEIKSELPEVKNYFDNYK